MIKAHCLRVLTILGVALSLHAGASEEGDSSSQLMIDSAHHFLSSLTTDQRTQTLFEFTQEAFEAWHYIPMRRRSGIKYADMTPSQVRLADALVASGLSRTGYSKAKSIMSLEQLVLDLEIKEGRRSPVADLRNPDFYYFALFGEPSMKGLWGWRVEGHHISFHYAMRDGKIISSSPLFLGSEPHEVQDGPRIGIRVLGDEENKARALLGALDDEQLKKALVSRQAPKDIQSRNLSVVSFDTVPKEGLRRAAMTPKQQGLLQSLIDEYIDNVPVDLRGIRERRVAESGDDIYFVWMGDTEPGIGHPHYYRVHGKSFLIEYDNIQNNANHVHTVWRDYENDFGRDVLAEHYRSFHK